MDYAVEADFNSQRHPSDHQSGSALFGQENGRSKRISKLSIGRFEALMECAMPSQTQS
jgi:hypothetical protein